MTTNKSQVVLSTAEVRFKSWMLQYMFLQIIKWNENN